MEFLNLNINSEINTIFTNNNIKSIVYYKDENIIKKYNKLCMVKVADQELLVSSIGIDHYFKHLNSALIEIGTYLKSKDYCKLLKTYIIDGGTFVVVANDDIDKTLFINIIKDLHLKFRYIKPNNTELPIIARYAVVFDSDNLVECALSELNDNDNLHMDLIINDDNIINQKDVDQEVEMINIIQWAIINHTVIPYYQGIYNTQSQSIDRYEALMRIKDCNGIIHNPISFLSIAKKYQMYPKLSEMMLEKVLSDMEKYGISSSINLSAYDINSKQFRDNFFELVTKHNPSNSLAIEILEDETFDDNTNINDFMKQIRALGIKVAIDDFGSGYSNLLKIIQLKPDYVKIDGNIIKDLQTSTVSVAAFETIMYLASKIGAGTVAEYVENIQLANMLQNYGVNLLQGYHFSIPLPIEDILTLIDD